MAPFHPPASQEGRAATRLLVAALVIFGLQAGRDILAPLALALLLTVAALPVVDWMQRLRVPIVPAVVAVLLAVLGLMGVVLYVLASQAFLLLEAMPRYENELRAKLVALGTGSGPVNEVLRLINRLGAATRPAEAPAVPVVMLAEPPTTPLAALGDVLGVVLAPAAITAITLLLMAFLLINRRDVRDRVLRLMGTEGMHRTTQAMQDATVRVGRFLLMQVMVNAVFGLGVALGLWGLGVPNAPLWGVLGFVLRFVPYLGAPLAALFPIMVAFATTEGWQTVLLVGAWFLLFDTVISYALEPWLYGASAGVTPLALVLSSIFWAALWGPIGLILAPAITACLAIAGRHLPALGFLDVLLGDEAALSPAEGFYQRLLAADARGAARLLANAATTEGEVAALRQLVEPAISRIAADRPAADYGAALATSATRALITAMATLELPAAGAVDVLVLPAGGALDRAAAAMAVAALREVGLAAGSTASGAASHVVLVVTTAMQPLRLERAMAQAHRMGREVLLFSPVEDGARVLARLEPPPPCLENLQALLEALG
jgi:predicted PurR-regulated permease PerM